MKMTILELFLVCSFKDPKLAEKWTNLEENPDKKINSTEFIKFVFSKSVTPSPIGSKPYLTELTRRKTPPI